MVSRAVLGRPQIPADGTRRLQRRRGDGGRRLPYPVTSSRLLAICARPDRQIVVSSRHLLDCLCKPRRPSDHCQTCLRGCQVHRRPPSPRNTAGKREFSGQFGCRAVALPCAGRRDSLASTLFASVCTEDILTPASGQPDKARCGIRMQPGPQGNSTRDAGEGGMGKYCLKIFCAPLPVRRSPSSKPWRVPWRRPCQ